MDLELVSSLVRVRDSGSLFQSNVCTELIFARDLRAVRYIGVSARRELTVIRSSLVNENSKQCKLH